MSAKKNVVQKENRLAFYMDLLGHDLLNNNQAVMSYLELIMATPGTDKKVKGFAEKAVSHVRTSTTLVDNVKRLMATKDIDPDKLKAINVVESIAQAELELRRHFPAKRIRLESGGMPKEAFVIGDMYASDLILNVLITAVRLDRGDDVLLKVTLDEEKHEGKAAWLMSIENKSAQLPPFLDGEGVAATYSQDVSTAVKTTGMLFAKMISANLGGDFEAHSLYHDPNKKGARFTVILRKAERP